ncbi:MAG TPA: transporter [Stellaceae bacterium]|nr:transporter [Stellaceae bacterium]
MTGIKYQPAVAALAALAVWALPGTARALEPGSVDPHLPGVTEGIPTATLPPPGVYFTNDLAYIDASVQTGSGKKLTTPAGGINVIAWVEVPLLLWSSPWQILGAQYGAFIAQPLVNLQVHSFLTGNNFRTGLYNTIINPAILSWHVAPTLFLGVNMPIYFRDGSWSQGAAINIANHSWTFGPSGAVSYINGDFMASANLEFDIQTENKDFAPGLRYQSGDIMTVDYTVQQTFGKWTAGVVGFGIYQVEDDKLNGTATPANFAGLGNSTGNRFEAFSIGPSIGYNFGPIALNLRYTRDVYARNGPQGDLFWFRFALPL